MSKPKVEWSAKTATVVYEASLQSKSEAVRKALLDGDWTFDEPKASKKRHKRRDPKAK